MQIANREYRHAYHRHKTGLRQERRFMKRLAHRRERHGAKQQLRRNHDIQIQKSWVLGRS